MRKGYLVRCNCHAFHFMEFEWYTEDTTQFLGVEGYLSVGGDFRKTFRDRVSNAARVLLGRNASVADVILSREEVIKLRNALETFLWDAGYENPPFHSCTPACAHPERQDLTMITETVRDLIPIDMATRVCPCCRGRWSNCGNCHGTCTAGCSNGTVER